MFSSRQYKRVSQHADSDEDEVTLFDTAAGEFGAGSYDRDGELNLPSVSVTARKQGRGRHSLLMAVCLFAVVLSVVLSIAVTVAVFTKEWGHTPLPSHSLLLTPSPPPQSPTIVAPSDDTTVSDEPTLPSAASSELSTTSSGAPPTTATSSEAMATAATNSDAPPTSATNSKAPPITAEAPPITATSSDAPPTTATSSDAPPTTATSSDAPPTTTTNSEAPPTTATSSDAPPTTATSSDAPPTTATSSEAPPITYEAPPNNDAPPTHSVTPSQPVSINWEREFFPASTECTLQLADMNRDGVLDVVGVNGFSMCAVKVVAMDGRNGTVIWEEPVDFPAFAVKCELDLDGDETIDCLVAGRISGFVALSGADGHVLWARDPSSTFFRYNFYFPLILDDLDGDGVSDLANMHGGDSTYTDHDTDRSPGMLVLLSGQTGQKLMEPLLTPDGGESYMSPVLFSFAGGTEVILFGTGGETLPGSLWAVTLDSLRERVGEYMLSPAYSAYQHFTEYKNHPCLNDMTYDQIEVNRPTFDTEAFDWDRNASGSLGEPPSDCPSVGGRVPIRNKYSVCVYELVRGEKEGVILPPVVVDMTGDETSDIIVSTFDGRTLIIDGQDGSIVWERTIPGTESYSIPAPLFFNDDGTPDLLVRINHGVYREGYTLSSMAVLDGNHGNTLWVLNSSSTGMMSGLSVISDTHGEDAAVFFALGRQLSTHVPGQEEKEEEEEGGVKLDSLEGLLEGNFSKRASQCRPLENSQQCPSLDWSGVVREERHMGGDLGDIGGDNEEQEDNGIMDYSFDPIQESLKATDPPDLWDDPAVPDPHTDFPAFLRYCGHSAEELSGSLYFVTQAMASSGHVHPLITHPPLFYDPPSHPSRRHGHMEEDHHLTAKDIRCGHIEVPLLIPPSPVVGDLDGDGRLEVAYVVIYSPMPHGKHPPRVIVKAFTLEDRYVEQFGPGGFPNLLSRQPWWRYMGAHGNGVFSLN